MGTEVDAEQKATRRKHDRNVPKPDGWLSKAEIRRRTNAVAVWSDFVGYRDEFKKQGFDHDQAWQAAWQKIKPVYDDRVLKLATKSIADTIRPVDPGQIVAGEVFSEGDAAKGFAVNFRSDIEWVYRHLGQEVIPTEAPNSGAWRLLEWARKNEKDFFLGLFQKVLPTKSQLDEEAAMKDDHGVIGLLSEVEAAAKEIETGIAV